MFQPAPGRKAGAAALSLVALAVLGASACQTSEKPARPLATPSVTLSRQRVPLGNPLDLTYKFVMAPDATFNEDYHVLVHFADRNEELIFADDHDPPTPTTQWKPGQTIEYTRTMFVPVYPYVGEATIEMGLYAFGNQPRLPLVGEDVGQRAYLVGRVELAPQSDALFTNFKEGWYAAEAGDGPGMANWHWTKKTATLVVKNPRKDSVFYLDIGDPGRAFEEPQRVTVTIGAGAVLDEFTLAPPKAKLRKIPLPAAVLGSGETIELRIAVDKTFVPLQDRRELGIRVIHAVVVEAPG